MLGSTYASCYAYSMAKKCSRCNKEKDLDKFFNLSQSKDGKQPHCKKCDQKRRLATHRRQREASGVKYRSTLLSQELKKKGLKVCPGCDETKSIENSYYGTTSVYCIICASKRAKTPHIRELNRKYYKKDKTKVRDYRLRTKYGITLEHYNEMLSDQGGKCVVCGATKEENKKGLAVDHCHETGNVRALLCGNCNCALGFIKENSEIARSLADYIDNYC